MSRKQPIQEKRHAIRELQEFAVAEMYKSIPKHKDRKNPKVSAILVDNEYKFICAAQTSQKGRVI